MDDSPPIATSPLDLSHATPELWAALAKAQAAVKSVSKDGYNADKRYAYTTADSMIAAGGMARSAAGGELAVVTAWEQEVVEPPESVGTKDGPGQWPVALVTLHFAIGHAGGGYIRGTASCHAIGSRARPPDKAVAAALTYAEGFVERGIMRLDRSEGAQQQDAAHDVDSRSEPEHTASAPPSFNGKAKPKETKAAAEQRRHAELQANVRKLYEQLGGKAWRAWSEICKGANAPKGSADFAGLMKIDTYLAAELAKASRERQPGEDDDIGPVTETTIEYVEDGPP